eukprot:TRINITY_DN101178_c0_g1_i1.p1 TRINITY_DN101178_c0_g1~~TRINITY_DN101178_c0_g1_i1.p1  ORF type:complete len:155 (+),score=29.05 TRINITY_DN101178_c0_g1_i1:216-680(+)
MASCAACVVINATGATGCSMSISPRWTWHEKLVSGAGSDEPVEHPVTPPRWAADGAGAADAGAADAAGAADGRVAAATPGVSLPDAPTGTQSTPAPAEDRLARLLLNIETLMYDIKHAMATPKRAKKKKTTRVIKKKVRVLRKKNAKTRDGTEI